ncbi:GSCOCG00001527001-RA-CDS [Cotesia congregata]|nr:GSCOCG00001527001-RA-CDS [Cotesia congregata]
MAGEKRNQDQEQDTQRKETIVIVDIEGTTTSISFVKNLKDYVEKKWDDAEFKDDIAKLKEQAEKDAADKVEGLVSITGETPEETKESLMKNVLWQMDSDRKSGALKQLQGHMWRDAYKSGAVKGHVYEDVPKALEDWTKNGRKVYVYSSGSVEAQKLLFGHSEHGDLLKHFSDYFDTEVGPKQEAASYKNILTKIKCDDASKVLFLTDIPKEAKAAVEAGMASVVVTREGNAALTAEEKTTYSTVKSFLDLTFQSSAKRQKVDSSEAADEPKKTEETPVKAAEPAEAAVEDVEMKDVSEKKVEAKSDAAEEEKSKLVEKVTPVKPTEAPKEAMECETTTDAAVEPEKSSKETEKVAEDAVACPKKVEEKLTKEASDKPSKEVDEKTTKEAEQKVTKEAEQDAEETVAKASTSEADNKPESEAVKSDTPVEEKAKQTEQSKSEPTTNLTSENKTEQAEKVVDAPIAETKMETDVENKPETAVVKDKPTTEPPKTDDSPKVEEKPEEVKEPAPVSKTETKEAEEKPAVEEAKQNGDSKSEKVDSITTNGTTTEVKTNGNSTETTVAPETKEPEKAVVDNAKLEAVEPEPVKSEPVKEEEKAKEEVVEKKLNGSTPTTEKTETTETAHRNGVNEEAKQNGGDESPADKESIKVKKVVDTIAADGAGEPEVVPPVPVVAATS